MDLLFIVLSTVAWLAAGIMGSKVNPVIRENYTTEDKIHVYVCAGMTIFGVVAILYRSFIL